MFTCRAAAANQRNAGSHSDVDSEEENEEGDYTVYECPGLAPTGEMEVKNPLFQDDVTPVSSPQVIKEPEPETGSSSPKRTSSSKGSSKDKGGSSGRKSDNK